MPAFLLAMLPARFVKFALIAGTVLALMVVVALMYRSHQRSVAEDAITLDRADIRAEVSNRVIAADRAATASAIERDQAFANSQDQAKDATDEAARNRTSPLDALYRELR